MLSIRSDYSNLPSFLAVYFIRNRESCFSLFAYFIFQHFEIKKIKRKLFVSLKIERESDREVERGGDWR